MIKNQQIIENAWGTAKFNTCQLQLLGRLLTTTPYSVRRPPVAPRDLSSRPTINFGGNKYAIQPNDIIAAENLLQNKMKTILTEKRVTQYLL